MSPVPRYEPTWRTADLRTAASNNSYAPSRTACPNSKASDSSPTTSSPTTSSLSSVNVNWQSGSAELEQQQFETQEALRQATEELDAARAVNRELMIRANRADAQRPSAGLPPAVVTAKAERRTQATPT